jgi:hypothetical protein
VRGLEPGDRFGRLSERGSRVERKVVSLPPVTVMRPFSFRMRLSHSPLTDGHSKRMRSRGARRTRSRRRPLRRARGLGNSERAAARHRKILASVAGSGAISYPVGGREVDSSGECLSPESSAIDGGRRDPGQAQAFGPEKTGRRRTGQRWKARPRVWRSVRCRSRRDG